MTRSLRITFVGLLAAGTLPFVGVARADVSCTTTSGCTNAEDGDNDSSTDQGGESASGDAVAGQVTGVVSAGDTSVDATNRSEDVDIQTGDTTASNSSANFTGQASGAFVVTSADVDAISVSNAQDGDNSTDIVQAAESNSGDGVGGQVIGVVTSAGGSADVVAANTSDDVGIETGDAETDNTIDSFVGQSDAITALGTTADVDVTTALNAQEGDNDLGADQSSESSSGDGVGGQVLGIVSAGDVSVDATNESTEVDLETGDADSSNAYAAFVGQAESQTELDAGPLAADVIVGSAENAQEGDNSKDLRQSAVASSGDAVGGMVAGVVTSAGGSADLVLANTSEDVDGETGEAEFTNTAEDFVGESAATVLFEPPFG